MKHVAIIAVVIVAVALILPIAAFSLMPTEMLLAAASGREAPWLQSVSGLYLRHVRKLSGYDRTNIPPLQFVLAGCAELPESSEAKQHCLATADWVVKQPEDINEVSPTRAGLTALHSALLSCDVEQVDFLMQRGANPSIKAGGTTSLHHLSVVEAIDAGKFKCSNLAQLRSAVLR